MGRFDPLTEEHVLINRYRIPGGSEMEVFITSRIPFVNMIETGLDVGSWSINSTTTGSNSFNSRDPNFFLIFQSENFSLQKTFLMFVIQTKG